MNRNTGCLLLSLILAAALISGCSSTSAASAAPKTAASGTSSAQSSSDSAAASSSSRDTTGQKTGIRDSTPSVRVPSADGISTYGNDSVVIDASHPDEGYVMVDYVGNVSPVKLRITVPDGTIYTYDLHGGYETFPLTGGSGSYLLVVYENVTGNQYSTCYSTELDAQITDEFGPYLYPSQYVAFSKDSKAVSLGEELARPADTDLDVVKNVYTYTTEHISYDTEKANTVKSGYLPDVDAILDSGKGICFDYAAVMAAMLRSQNIPTRLEIGYAGTVYHAWVSVHTDELGWVNGIIEFDGQEWKLMDPTFAAGNASKDLQSFIGDGSNYQTKYVY